MGRLPTKRAEKVAEAAEKGRIKAQLKAEKSKPIELTVKELLISWASKLEPMETIAIIGGTIVVHEIILKTQDFVDSLKNITILGKNPDDLPVVSTLWQTLMTAFGQESPLLDENQKPVFSSVLNSDLVIWFISFAISYMVVRHGGDLMTVAKGFFALK